MRTEHVVLSCLETKRFSLVNEMSLNWAELNERKQPIPINDEVIVRSEPNADIVLSFNPPDANQAAANGKAQMNTLKATGAVYVSDQRVGRSSPGSF